MPDDQYYLRIKEEAERWLFKLPGVRGVGLGPKFTAGRAIGKSSIRVYVESKRSAESLDASEVIPEFIKDIPTDVCEWRETVNTQGEITVDDCPTGVIKDITPIPPGPTPTDFEVHSPAHGLVEPVRVRFTGPENKRINNFSYTVTVKDSDTFLISVRENGADNAPLFLPVTPDSMGWISVCSQDTLCCCPNKAITFVGSAGGKVSIGSDKHGLLSGDRVRIRKSPNRLEPGFFQIKKVDENNFELVGANPADFGGVPTGWRWHKVSIARTGRISRIVLSNPVVIHSSAHGLVKNDHVVLQTIDPVSQSRLDNHVNRNIAPYRVERADDDSFILVGVDGRGGPDIVNDFVGSWIQIKEDFRKYDRTQGGIRIEMKKSETETVVRTPTNPASSPMTTSIKPDGGIVHVEVTLNTGTLGCIATDESAVPKRKVLLSNAHVIYSGTDNDEVHHPDFYTSSRSCSKHKIAQRVRQVFGPDPAHPGITVDAAIAKFDPDKGKYDPFIVDIGPVKGTAPVTQAETRNGDYRVWKRGAQTGITEGIIVDTALTFTSTEDNIEWRNQLLIEPIAGRVRGFMSVHGDSGSVAVNKDNKVVGLLSKARQGGEATANPIADVENALQIKIWKEGDPISADEVPIDPGTQVATAGIPDLFSNTLAELSSTEGGSHFAVIVKSHIAEVMNLMETNKKFAATWQRNHGPELMQHLREAVEVRTRPMPTRIQGIPFRDLLTNISTALKKFGSPELSEHAKEFEGLVLHLLTLSYEDMLLYLERNPTLATMT